MKTYQPATPECLAMAEMLSGEYGLFVPHIWFEVFKTEAGLTDSIAINILAEITYWYRAVPVFDENGRIKGHGRKFAADILQKSYRQLSEKFGYTERQIKDAVVRLEKRGVLKREFRTIETNGQLYSNVLYIRIYADAIRAISFTEVPKFSAPSDGNKIPLSRKNEGGATEKRQYTEITPEITNINNIHKVGANSANAKLDPDRVLFSGEIKESQLVGKTEQLETNPLKSISEHEHTKAPLPPAAEIQDSEDYNPDRLPSDWMDKAFNIIGLANELFNRQPETPPQITEPCAPKTVENAEVVQSINSKEKDVPRARQAAKTAFYYENGEAFNLENCHTNFVNLFSGWRKAKGLSAPKANLAEFRRLLTCDGRTPDQIRAVYGYLKERGLAVNGDGKFLVEVEGIKSLREEFEKIEKQMSQRKGLNPLPKTTQPLVTKTYPTYDPFA